MTLADQRKFYDIHLTPISPIHIGCGEDYEPTNFIVDEEKAILYGFEPSTVYLPEDKRSRLLRRTKLSIADIYKFYLDNKEYFLPFANVVVPIDHRTNTNISKLISGGYSTQKENNNYIQRTTYERKGLLCQPYIPGSSIKGVLHGALLDRLNNENDRGKKDNLDNDIFGGTMGKSPMRLIKISDFRATTDAVKTRIIMAKRLSKQFPFSEKDPDIQSSLEVIELGQYRAFDGSLSIQIPQGSKLEPKSSVSYKNIYDIFKDINKKSLTLFEKESSVWEKGNRPTQRWISCVSKFIKTHETLFHEGKLALIRIGKNSTAENLVLSGKDVAKIQIMIGRGESVPMDHATTLFSAPEEQTSGLTQYLPFGWAILEIEGLTPCLPIEVLCSDLLEENSMAQFDLKSIRANLQAQCASLEAEKARELELKHQEEQKKREEELKQKEQEEKLAKLSENQRNVTELSIKLAQEKSVPPGSDLYNRAFNLIQDAQNWSVDDKKYCHATLYSTYKKLGILDSGNKKKILKGYFRSLVGENQ